jgi:hypothetical protein
MINKELLKAILEGRLKKKFALFLRDSEYTPVFMRIGNTELFTGSTHDGTIKASSEELDALEQIIEINRIDISIEQ